MSIQAEIDRKHAGGGGTVVVPPGIHSTGPLELKSHVTLRIENGAVLQFKDDPDLYPPVWTRWGGIEGYVYQPLLWANGAESIAVVGEGTLDGNGQGWWDEFGARQNGKTSVFESDKAMGKLNREAGVDFVGAGGSVLSFMRPPLIQFKDCTGVKLQGVTCRNSPFWNTHILYCRDVQIHGVTFRNPADAPNGDGLDIDSSTYVSVSDCLFDVGDDCLCLKSGTDADGRRVGRPTENVVVNNCLMRHGHGGVVMGSEIAGGIRNVVVSNCIFDGTDRGIRLKSRRGRGGSIEDIHFSNIIMRDVISAVVMNLYYACGIPEAELEWAASKSPQEVDESTPMIRNISLSRVVASGLRNAAVVLMGLPEAPLQGISLTDCRFDRAPGAPQGEPAMTLNSRTYDDSIYLENVCDHESLR